jgi:hypothetical protein
MANEPVLLDLKQAEAKYGLKVSTWRLWIYQRKVEVVRLGRRVFLKEESIRQLINDNTTSAKKR